MEKPTFKQRVDAFTTFLWDSNTGKVLGRGGRSWAEIGVFYIIYYACLASFFAATLAVFYETVPTDQPKLLSDSSLLDGNPGLGFRPMVDIEEKKVTVKAGGLGKNKGNIDNLKSFLKPYRSQATTDSCSSAKGPRLDADMPCAVDYASLTKECNEDNDFGHSNGKPCVLLKMNKVYGWVPKLWKNGDGKIPDDVAAGYDELTVPIRCTTKEKKDAVKLGAVSYYPKQGFGVPYYPYLNQKGYLSPLVFVQFGNITRDRSYDIECRIYAKNVEYDRTEVQGSVQFKIHMK